MSPTPTEPGFYWAKDFPGDPWGIVEVLVDVYRGPVPHLRAAPWNAMDYEPLSDFAVWGPKIEPPEEQT